MTVVDLAEEDGRATVRRNVEAGGTAQFVRADITNEDDADATVSSAVDSYGGLHGAFNNVGIIGASRLITDAPLEE